VPKNCAKKLCQKTVQESVPKAGPKSWAQKQGSGAELGCPAASRRVGQRAQVLTGTGRQRSGRRMQDLAGRLAVVTGGASGMGRELVRQLVAEGCHVAMCEVSAEAMEQTRQLCVEERSAHAPQRPSCRRGGGTTGAALPRRGRQRARHGQGALASTMRGSAAAEACSPIRAHWERTFNICWGGVHFNACVPSLADEGRAGPHRQYQ